MTARYLTHEETVTALENIGDMDPMGVFDDDGHLILVGLGGEASDVLVTRAAAALAGRP